MKRILTSLLVFGLVTCAFWYVKASQKTLKGTHITIFPASPGSVLPAVNNVSTNWANAGLASIGGIPNRTTQCGSTVSPIGGGSDDYTHIQNAINSCPSGNVVQLAAGTSVPFTGSLSGNSLTASSCLLPVGYA